MDISKLSRSKSADGIPLIYTDYKEPLRKIEDGYGYYGTLGISEDGEYVQCAICGLLFLDLSVHIRAHKTSAAEYKKEFKLAETASLMGETTREKRQRNAVKLIPSAELPAHLRKYNEKVQSGEIRHGGNMRRQGGYNLQRRNKLGVCPDQVLEKVELLAKKLGHAPSQVEFSEEYGGRYLTSIKFQHGSWSNAIHMLDMKTKEELKAPDKEQLLDELRLFHRGFGRIPTTSDFNRGKLRDRGVYTRAFGSLNNARIEAGLNAILPLGFGQMIEVSPEEYLTYKNR